MIPMTAKLRKIVAAEIATATCARADSQCSGRLTVEHAFGRKVQKRWQFIYLCWFHHFGPGFSKSLNEHLAYQQADETEIRATFPKTAEAHLQKKNYLMTKYG